jgi:formiminoglutamase
VVVRCVGGPVPLRKGQPVLLGFPVDEGVRRNQGRPGAASAADAIREQLYRLTTWDPEGPRSGARATGGTDLASAGIIDLGNIRADADLETCQERLGEVIGGVLQAGAVPVVLGGGHETAYGHYLGYLRAGLEPSVINIDAHLDVRPYPQGSHSGSSFRQMIEHPRCPLKPGRYVVLGAQRQCVARSHWEFVHQRRGRIHWFNEDLDGDHVIGILADELSRLGCECDSILLSVDADAFRQADVPGVSAPSPIGLEGSAWPGLAFQAGCDPKVRSLELVEVNPAFDRDKQTVRWAALGIRQFLVGLTGRPR